MRAALKPIPEWTDLGLDLGGWELSLKLRTQIAGRGKIGRIIKFDANLPA
jgi:hypothetical protein